MQSCLAKDRSVMLLSMWWRLYRLRERGRKRPSRDPDNDKPIVGHLLLAYVTHQGVQRRVMTLETGKDRPCYTLVDPKLTGVVSARMRFEGLEKTRDVGGAVRLVFQ